MGTAARAGGHGKRRSIVATVPAMSTQLCGRPGPPDAPTHFGRDELSLHSYPPFIAPHYHSPQCPTARYHVVIWYIPGMRTRVPSFG